MMGTDHEPLNWLFRISDASGKAGPMAPTLVGIRV